MKEQEQQMETVVQNKIPLISSVDSSRDDNKISKKAAKSLQKYRKKLLAQVVAIFLICLIVILQRVFYQIIVESEENVLAKLQLDTDLVQEDQHGVIYATGIKNGFLKFYGSLSQFPVQFLFLTHVLATLFVSFDALLATKVIFITMLATYLVSLIQMFYAGARPFWANNEILSSCCLQSYNHPSLGLVLLTFVPSYTFYNLHKKSPSQSSLPLPYIILIVSVCLLTLVSQFLNYYIGTMYLINIFISLIISALLLLISIAANTPIESWIRRSTILKTQAKKYIFYWLLFICLIGTFVLVVYSGQDLFVDIDWVDSFMRCTKYQQYAERSYRYDEIIGPWFNFMQISVLFGWIGAVFGIAVVFREMGLQWSAGATKGRLTRALIANVLIIPSWFFVLLVQGRGTWVRDIGLNDFIVNSVHFFLLYIWIFGYMPVLLLHRLLKITNKEDQDFYVIVEDSDVKADS